MFFPNSRYVGLATYQVTKSDGTVVTATRLPLPVQRQVMGFFPRQNNQPPGCDCIALRGGRHRILATLRYQQCGLTRRPGGPQPGRDTEEGIAIDGR